MELKNGCTGQELIGEINKKAEKEDVFSQFVGLSKKNLQSRFGTVEYVGRIEALDGAFYVPPEGYNWIGISYSGGVKYVCYRFYNTNTSDNPNPNKYKMKICVCDVNNEDVKTIWESDYTDYMVSKIHRISFDVENNRIGIVTFYHTKSSSTYQNYGTRVEILQISNDCQTCSILSSHTYDYGTVSIIDTNDDVASSILDGTTNHGCVLSGNRFIFLGGYMYYYNNSLFSYNYNRCICEYNFADETNPELLYLLKIENGESYPDGVLTQGTYCLIGEDLCIIGEGGIFNFSTDNKIKVAGCSYVPSLDTVTEYTTLLAKPNGGNIYKKYYYEKTSNIYWGKLNSGEFNKASDATFNSIRLLNNDGYIKELACCEDYILLANAPNLSSNSRALQEVDMCFLYLVNVRTNQILWRAPFFDLVGTIADADTRRQYVTLDSNNWTFSIGYLGGHTDTYQIIFSDEIGW